MSNGVGKQNGDILDRDELNFPRLPHGIGTVPLASGTATQFTIITTAVAKSEFTYDPATLAVDTETISYDLDATAGYEFFRVLDRSRDALGHDTGFILGSTPAPGVGGGAPASTIVEAQAAYAYSPTDGRIAQISNPQIPNQAFIYQYLPNSDLIEKVTGPIHTVTNSWEPNRDVLDFKQNKVGTTIISSYDYAVNAIGQRTGVATSGTAYPALPSWLWSYDALGQVVAADSSIATSDRAYQYDAIGNRQKTANSLTLPVANNYTANSLNQYTSLPSLASLASVPSYDFDGNMTSGPLPVSPTTNSTLLWDGENRLTEVKNSAGTIIEKNIFDSGSRKIATTANGVTTIYLYDGWNCIAEYQGDTGVSPVLKKTRLWGTDLSGSMQGAGGVGGMLSESSPITSNPITFNSSYPTYDGNGNVSEYLDSTGQVIAHFEYDPFGITVVNTDTSNQFSYRFSTKPIAFATGFYYYGYRYYDPMTGRWPSRDPIEEKGGINLYGFVKNDGVNKWDILGQKCAKNKCDKWRIEALGNFSGGAVAVAGSIYTKLRAIGEDCCMDEYVNYYNFNALGVGAGFAAGASVAFPPGLGDHEFTTSCISWDDHVGWGNFTGVSGGVFCDGNNCKIVYAADSHEWFFIWRGGRSFYWNSTGKMENKKMSAILVGQIISVFLLGCGFVLSALSKSIVVSIMGDRDYDEFKKSDQSIFLNDPFCYYKEYKFLVKYLSICPNLLVSKFYRYSHILFLCSAILFVVFSILNIFI